MRAVKAVAWLLVYLLGALVAFVYIAPEKAAKIAVEGERDRSGLARKEVTLPDGLNYVYLEGGQGEPLMLLHGFGANKDNFTRVAKFLTPHYRVIVPDHIGFGESSHPPEADYTPKAQAERLRALAQALQLQNLHLGGSSMGGHIAMSYAAAYPDEVRSLWLLDPAGIWSAPKSDLALLIEQTGRNALLAKNEEEFEQIFHFAMSDPPFIPRPFLKVFAQERIRNHDLEQRIFQQLRSDSVEARVKGLQTPALIVFGEKDRAIHPGTGPVLHKLLPKSQLIMMPDIGHLPMLENPKQSAADYLAFRSGG